MGPHRLPPKLSGIRLGSSITSKPASTLTVDGPCNTAGPHSVGFEHCASRIPIGNLLHVADQVSLEVQIDDAQVKPRSPAPYTDPMKHGMMEGACSGVAPAVPSWSLLSTGFPAASSSVRLDLSMGPQTGLPSSRCLEGQPGQPGQPLLNRHQVGGVSRSPGGLLSKQVRGKRTDGGRPGQRGEEQGTWASRTQKHSEAGYRRPVLRSRLLLCIGCGRGVEELVVKGLEGGGWGDAEKGVRL
jgi:hypothetical protein